MEKSIFKERFEYIIGFLALAISLNGFKEEMKAIRIDLLYISFTLSDYIFSIILAALLALLLYFIPQFLVFNSSFWKGFNKVMEIAAFLILGAIVFSPLLIGLLYIAFKVSPYISSTVYYSIIASFLGFFLTVIITTAIERSINRRRLQREIEDILTNQHTMTTDELELRVNIVTNLINAYEVKYGKIKTKKSSKE